MTDLKIAIFFAKNRRKFKKLKFRYKSSEYQNFTGFLLIQKENGNANMFCKFQHHSMQIFFKMRINVFLKLKRLRQPPSPSDFDGLPYPRVRWHSKSFFMKMTAKDVKEITYIPLVTFSGNRKGDYNNPLG